MLISALFGGSPSVSDTDSNYGFGTYQNISNLGDVYNQIREDALKIQEREDSAYQRAVADLKKAGLNPWLAVQGSGASTSDVNPSGSALDSLLSMLNANNEATSKKDKNERWILDFIQKLGLGILKIM